MEIAAGPVAWLSFIGLVVGLLLVDLLVVHRHSGAIGTRDAVLSSVAWIAIAIVFGGVLWWAWGRDVALTYYTGYLIEKALSVDNLFVIVMIFSYFAVALEHQRRVLFWGVLGVLIMRGMMIAVGAALLARLEWLIYGFGAFLVFTAIRMTVHKEEQVDLDKNMVVRAARRMLPVSSEYDGEKFITRRTGRRMATPLLLVLIVVETTDLVFALDSIPAIFGVTRNTFVVFSSNVFAILGLRSLYFLLAGVIFKFRFIKYGLAGVLAFVGGKMLLEKWIHIPTGVSLAVVAFLIGLSVVISLMFPAKLPETCPHCSTDLDPDSDICPGCGEIVIPTIMNGSQVPTGSDNSEATTE